MSISIVLPDNYGYVLLLAITFVFEYTMVGFIVGGGSRKHAFNEKWMDVNFGEEHRKAFGPDSKPSKEGYPDTGQGRYSQHLAYRDWFQFNLSQRCHGNFTETVVQQTLAMLVCGVFYPTLATYLGVASIVGRLAYTVGYQREPKARVFGFIVTMLSLLTMTGAAIKGVSGLL